MFEHTFWRFVAVCCMGWTADNVGLEALDYYHVGTGNDGRSVTRIIGQDGNDVWRSYGTR